MKYAEKQTRRFDEGKLKAGQSVIGLQVSGIAWSPLSSTHSRPAVPHSEGRMDRNAGFGVDVGLYHL